MKGGRGAHIALCCWAFATAPPGPAALEGGAPLADDARPGAESSAAEPGAEPDAIETSPRGQQWDAITMFHGMPSRNVRAIVQDRDGLLWFGTDAGLVRYDGQRIERVPLARTPAAVLALAVDAAGRLWVGTERGAFVRTPQGWLELPHTTGQAIAAILLAGDGRMRLASRRGRIYFCSTDGRQVEALGPETAALLRRADGVELELAALGERSGRLLIGTRGRGVLALDGRSVREVKDPLRPFFVNAIAGGRDTVVLGAETNPLGRGLFSFDGTRMRPVDVRTGPVVALANDTQGGVWAGTRERGLVHLRRGRPAEALTLASTGGGLHSDRIHALLVDRDGVLWVGTDRGVCRYDPNAPRAIRLGPSADSNFVQSLFASPDGRLWAGTQRGLFVRSGPDGPWQVVPALAGRAVHAIGAAADGRLLVGCAGGLEVERADGSGWQSVPRSDPSVDPEEDGAATAAGEGNSVRAIAAHRGNLYVATYGQGVERLDDAGRSIVWPRADGGSVPPAAAGGGTAVGTATSVGIEPALREVVSLAVVDDALWVGTADAGTFVLEGDPARGRRARDETLTVLGTLRCAAPDGYGGAWVGTSHGLYRRAAGGAAQPIVQGEDVRAVMPAAADRPSVWCATSRSGLLNVAVTPDLGVVRARVDAEYGLPSQSVFAMLATGSGLLLGTNRGLVEYDPGRGAPDVRFVRVLGRRPYTPEEWGALRLDYPQNGLLVQAAATGSRTYPERFQYAFHLEAGGRTMATRLSDDGQFGIENLAPGRYRVTARALGTNLVASAPAQLDFQVAAAPIPWPSIALAALLAAALAALAWGAIQYRGLRAANAALAETRLQLVQETENERRRIARDLHDQTLADLRGLLFSLQTSGPDAAAARDVETISSEVRRICEDLSPSVLENIGLGAALEWALDETLRRRPTEPSLRGIFSCSEGLAERLALDAAAEIQVYRIVQEALTNAARHAGARCLWLTVSLVPGSALEITLDDDGRGFDPASAPQGRGLANIRSRASLIGAQVEWRAREGGGTRFVLRTRNRPSRS